MDMPKATRVALYARYSSEKQRETSIVDQLRGGHELAARHGWEIVAQHADEGVSGSVPVALRRGGKALLADALASRFDVLVLEGLDRLSREIGEAETITKRLEHRGIRIVGTADGYDSEARGRKVMRIARGLVNELYLDDLREKTHRGLAGQFDRGFHVGGVTYGYVSHPAPDGRGHVLLIDESKAAVVRMVFELFAAGHSGRGIVHRLNAEGLPSPRGGTWAVSALVGDSKRGAGLLNNELYAGRMVWNRRQWLKEPETGKRRYVDRPASEWQVREVPDLRIVPAALWEAVRTRARSGPIRGTRTGRGQSPRTLFSGLLRCSECQGPMVAIDARRYGCNRRHDRGATVCGNAQAYPRERVDSVLMAAVRDDLVSPEAQAELHRAVREVLAEIAKGGSTRSTASMQIELQRLEAQIGRLVEAIATMGLSDALRARLSSCEAAREGLLRSIGQAALEPAPLRLEVIMAGYRRQLLQLQEALQEGADRDHARHLLAGLLGPVFLVAADGALWAEMEEPAERLLVAGSSPMGVVAGGCNASRRRMRIAPIRGEE